MSYLKLSETQCLVRFEVSDSIHRLLQQFDVDAPALDSVKTFDDIFRCDGHDAHFVPLSDVQCMDSNGLCQRSDEHNVMNWDVFSHGSHEICPMAFRRDR